MNDVLLSLILGSPFGLIAGWVTWYLTASKAPKARVAA
jgi:hypothetical protein